MSETLLHFIDGGSVAPVHGRFLDKCDPATGELLARVASGDAADVDLAVAAAVRAQPLWAAVPAVERANVLDVVADILESRRDELSLVESQDTGKPKSLAFRMDLGRAIDNFRFFAGAVRHGRTDFHEGVGGFNYTLRQPVGVAALITPWNLPLYLLSWKTAPALAMGNAVVAKPSELTPRTAGRLAEILRDAGLPPGVFNVVHGFGPDVGEPLVGHPDVHAVSFTGGTATGRRVAATAAPTFKKLSLELGGKNPTLVFADCDLEATLAMVVRSSFLNQGEICLCGSRILVERALHDRFVDGLVERVRALRVGDPRSPDTDQGALVSHAHRDKVEGYLRLAVQEGGTIRCGGQRPARRTQEENGAFLEPAVITGLSSTCRTATEEIFGPVVTVHPFDVEAEAIRMANGTRYGLASSVWTRDLGRAHRVAAALDCGMVWVNTWLLRDLRVPFGGTRESGLGREGGENSLRFFSQDKNVCIAT